jgi:hypothetical protein
MRNSSTPIYPIVIIAVVIFFFIGTKNQLSVIQKFKDTVKTVENVAFDKSNGSTNEEPKTKKVHSQEVLDYYDEIVMNSEFDGRSASAFKWDSDMKIYVEGEPTSELLSELSRIVSELNNIIDPVDIEVVSDRDNANYFVFFGSPDGFATAHPDINRSQLVDNWGLFQVSKNKGKMYVDIYRADLVEQKHLLREELTQSLGLLNDSYKYPESIFYQKWTSTTEYADIDIELIDMLYNN